MVLQATALIYPSLFALLATNVNYTIFADDQGVPYIIDISESNNFTEQDDRKIIESTMKTAFYLYTRDNPIETQQLFIDNLDSIRNSSFNPNNPTCLITHGWRGDTRVGTDSRLIRDAYLSVGDYNIILIDWREAASSLYYSQVVRNVPFVAKRVAKLIDILDKNMNLNPSTTRLVGHSLGAHIAGLAARYAKSEIAETIALDPAKPLFEYSKPGERVDKTDAAQVQVIHTNAGFLGLQNAIGHSDFYLNGGVNQPGCYGIVLFKMTCAHLRSYKYYAESITNPTGFRAGRVYMGGPIIDSNAKGKYILETNSKAPYARG